MALRLQLTWPKRDKPDDYQVFNESQAIGRMYRTRRSMGLDDRWIWTLFGTAIHGGLIDGDVPHGIADDRDQALEALTRAWGKVERHNAITQQEP